MCMLLVSALSVCSELSSTSSVWAVVSGSVMKQALSCRIHFLYTLITFLVADASQDGSRKALGGRTWNGFKWQAGSRRDLKVMLTNGQQRATQHRFSQCHHAVCVKIVTPNEIVNIN